MMNKRSHNVVFVWSGYEFSHFSASTDLSCNQAFDKGTLQLLAPDGQMAIWGWLGMTRFLQVDKKSVFQHNASFPLMESCPGPVEMLKALWGKNGDASVLYIHISRCGISSIFNLSTLKPTASKAAARNTLASYCSQNHLMKHRSTCYLYLFVGEDLTANFCQYTWAFRGVILICSQWPW